MLHFFAFMHKDVLLWYCWRWAGFWLREIFYRATPCQSAV